MRLIALIKKWAFAAPYLTLIEAQVPQRKYELRATFDALLYRQSRRAVAVAAEWRSVAGSGVSTDSAQGASRQF